MAFLDIKDKANAITAFSAALKLAPDFELAKNNKLVAEGLKDYKAPLK